MKISKRISFLLSYWGLCLMSLIFNLLPWNLSIKLGMFLCGAAAKIMSKRFKNNLRSVSIAFPEKTEKEVYEICLSSWKNMGRLAAEFIKCCSMSKEELINITEFRNMEFFEKSYREKKPFIIHTGHFSNWEIFGIAISARGYEKAVVAQGLKNPYIDKKLEKMRSLYNGSVISSSRPFFSCIKWIKKGKSLGILSDQSTHRSEVYLKFLGRWCACSPLTALLAIKTQIPVVPAHLYRENGKFIIDMRPPVFPPENYSQENIEKFVDTLNKYYEDWIRQRPEDWLWSHNRWKKEKDAPAYKQEHKNA